MSEKPRVRVRARKEKIIHVGGVVSLVEGYEIAFGRALLALARPCIIFKVDLISRDGDYDKYRVIYA